MSFRKQSPTANLYPWVMTEKEKYIKTKLETHHQFMPFTLSFKYAVTCVISLTFWFLILFFWFPSKTPHRTILTTTTQTQTNDHHPNLALKSSSSSSSSSSASASLCRLNMSVYMYELPPEFNLRLLEDCRHLNVYTNMCPYVVNSGLGQSVSDIGQGGGGGGGSTKSTSNHSWFATHQFIAEMIFHARLANHPCRTWDPSRATVFYVPFYGGLHASSKFREPNVTARDALAVNLAAYLQQQRWWRRRHGKDHFLALGRTSWDFMRPTTSGGTDFGANCLLNLPPVKNMSVLTVERNPWNGSNQHGIPYPSYFHPSTSDEMVTWQNQVSLTSRPHLFSFIGGPRKGLEKAAMRDELIKQCNESTRCELVNCDHGASVCHNPIEVLNVMKRSRFCLQAPGDSFTRRSTFDSVLAGCVPVFSSPHTAYSQYEWFLPGDRSSYSVYIDERSEASKRIEEELLKTPVEKVEKMRETVIGLIPRLTYMHPNATDYHHRFHDAVDVALSALSKHVRSMLR